LPGSAARIISQNFASCRLACSFRATLFFVFNLLTSFCPDWPGDKWAAAYFEELHISGIIFNLLKLQRK
jgi:hypothetical protein